MVDVETDVGTQITIGLDGVNSGNNFLGTIRESEAASSVANNFKETSVNVAFLMSVSNYSRQPLINHETFNQGGWVANRARSVKMGVMENVYGHKVSDTATGCSGTIAWKIGKTNKMLVVMYSVPYSHDWYANWCGVGIFDIGGSEDYFDKMYNGGETTFARKEFYYDSLPVVYKGEQFTVHAVMDKTHKTHIKVGGYTSEC